MDLKLGTLVIDVKYYVWKNSHCHSNMPWGGEFFRPKPSVWLGFWALAIDEHRVKLVTICLHKGLIFNRQAISKKELPKAKSLIKACIIPIYIRRPSSRHSSHNIKLSSLTIHQLHERNDLHRVYAKPCCSGSERSAEKCPNTPLSQSTLITMAALLWPHPQYNNNIPMFIAHAWKWSQDNLTIVEL